MLHAVVLYVSVIGIGTAEWCVPVMPVMNISAGVTVMPGFFVSN